MPGNENIHSLRRLPYDVNPDPLVANDGRLSERSPVFSSTPWPLQSGQELRPVVSHWDIKDQPQNGF